MEMVWIGQKIKSDGNNYYLEKKEDKPKQFIKIVFICIRARPPDPFNFINSS